MNALRLIALRSTALCERVWYKGFFESRAPRGSQKNLWFYIGAKRCILDCPALYTRTGGILIAHWELLLKCAPKSFLFGAFEK